MAIPGKNLDFARLYSIMEAPVTEFDCGTLCAPSNGGIPVCCEVGEIIPVLYKGEFKMLLERTGMWRKWQPKTDEDRKLKRSIGRYQLCECKGVAHCERDNRSLNCRTFPFMPYFDHDEVLAGIVYDYESAEGKCPLVTRPEVITLRYIEQSLEYWATLVGSDAEEADFYLDESERTRRRFARRRKPIPVLVPEGIRYYPTNRRIWTSLRADSALPRLKAIDRPKGGK